LCQNSDSMGTSSKANRNRPPSPEINLLRLLRADSSPSASRVRVRRISARMPAFSSSLRRSKPSGHHGTRNLFGPPPSRGRDLGIATARQAGMNAVDFDQHFCCTQNVNHGEGVHRVPSFLRFWPGPNSILRSSGRSGKRRRSLDSSVSSDRFLGARQLPTIFCIGEAGPVGWRALPFRPLPWRSSMR
jgi:hypothetical protein